MYLSSLQIKTLGVLMMMSTSLIFIDNYDHPIFEDGEQLVDMVYLKRER